MVKIENLVKKYDGFCLECSMEIMPGTVVGIIGKNGAGKSTTIKSILGLVKPDGGSITVFGKDARKLTAKDKLNLGVALAESGFSSYLTITDIIGILKRMYPSFDQPKFKELCEKQGLPMNKRIHDFSTGMKAKLRVLVAMSHDAKLLIMDEPTAGLDVTARNEVLDIIREYLAEDSERCLLISSHISSDLEGLCDEIYMISDGKIVLHEDTDAILGEYAILKVNDTMYEKIEKQYLLSVQKTNFGYICLTKEKQFYHDNYPDMVIENGSIDDLIVMMGQEK